MVCESYRRPKLSIGVLAHNEEPRIEETLRSLLAQDLFQRFETELVIVANGCIDKTAAVAMRVLANHRAVWSSCGSAWVEEISEAGKANAWNQFVHSVSSPEASILVLMDADITFLNAATISSMVATLKASSQAVICVDYPIKDVEFKRNRTLFDRVLSAATPASGAENVGLCGQLYCAYSKELRLLTLPVEIIVEDGFLRALVLTQGFTRPEDPRRIVRDQGAAHCFTPPATLRDLFKHEKWLVAGNIINAFLFERFWAEASTNRSAMTLMREWQTQDLRWLPHYVSSQVKVRGWNLVPTGSWTRRWRNLRALPLESTLRRFPIAAMAMVLDAVIFISAIIDVRRGNAFRYWRG